MPVDVENSVVLTLPRAVIPSWTGEPFALMPPPVETVVERVDCLKWAIKRRFGGKWREFKPEQNEPGFAKRVSSSPLEVERRFSDLIRLESGCESSEKGENRRGATLSHDPQE